MEQFQKENIQALMFDNDGCYSNQIQKKKNLVEWQAIDSKPPK